LTIEEKYFYSSLLTLGGPLVCTFVSNNLLGASLSSTRKFRASGSIDFQLAVCKNNVTKIANLMKEFKLDKVPCLISEDSSAVRCRIDVKLKGGKVLLFGLNNGVYEVSSISQMWELIKSKNLARGLYIYTLVPLSPHAPHFIIGAMPHDNTAATFNKSIVVRNWGLLQKFCSEEGLTLVGHVSDGAAAMRSAMLSSYTVAPGSNAPAQSLTIPHPLIEVFMAPSKCGMAGLVCGVMDWLHISWRLRNIFLLKKLTIGALIMNFNFIYALSKTQGTTVKVLFGDLSAQDTVSRTSREPCGWLT